MSDLEDLEQDVVALRREIESLTKRRDGFINKLHNDQKEELSREPITKEFEHLFSEYPELYRLLASDQNNLSIGSDVVSASEKSSEVLTPRKRQNTTMMHTYNVKENSNVTDHEWVLNTQQMVHHKMFNADIAGDIDTDILTSPSKRKTKLGLIDESTEVEASKTDTDMKSLIMIENMHRLFGITFFPVVDPSDLKINNESKEMESTRDMLGIRLEVYNVNTASFEQPFYILLKKRRKVDAWAIFKHTIPNSIDIHGLYRSIDNGLLNSFDDVYIFAKDVYIRLVQTYLRKFNLENLAMEGIISNLEINLYASMVSMHAINDRIQIKLFLKGDQVVSCNITSELDHPSSIGKWELTLLGPIDELALKIGQLDS